VGFSRQPLNGWFRSGVNGVIWPRIHFLWKQEAFTVPKILDYPPFAPTAARQMTGAAIGMLKQVAT